MTTLPIDLDARVDEQMRQFVYMKASDYDRVQRTVRDLLLQLDQQQAELTALRAAKDAAEGRQWQPIATAPKDEDSIILAFDGETHFATRGFTNTPRRAGWFDEKCWLIHPTHWMPLPYPSLPAPPVVQAAQKAGAE